MQKRLTDGGKEFPELKRVALPESLANAISEAIAAGRLLSGERIIEIPMAQKLGVSRVPLREALKVLHAQGILVGGGHKGYFVAEFDDRSLQRVNELRLPVETVLLRDALANWRTRKANPADLDLSLDQMWAAARQGDRRATMLADIGFHRVVRKAAFNEVAGAVWDTLARHLAIAFSLGHYRDSDLLDLADHHSVLREQIGEWLSSSPSQDRLSDAVNRHIGRPPKRRPGRG